MNKINWEILQSQIKAFSEKLNSSLEELGIKEKCNGLEIDHICVRLKDVADVDNLKTELEQAGQIISAVNVNGRKILIIQLHQPLILGLWQIFGIELPYPKPNHNYADGWEHVEFVLHGANNTMDGVREAFMGTFSNLNREQLENDYAYSEDQPHADGDQLPNPTIGLKVHGVGIKFHANPIQAVVGFRR